MADIIIDSRQLDRLIGRMSARIDTSSLLDAIGEQQEDAARRRVRQTKRAPGGEAWDPWSDRYAKTRGNHHSVLVGTGHLADTMTHQPEGEHAVHVGSNLEYAAAHLYGWPEGRIPARPFLDTSGDFEDPRDRAEIEDLVSAFVAELLG